VIKRGQNLGLALETRQALGVKSKFGRQDLQRDVAINFVSRAR
jgi:hypothetical protein